MGINIKPGEKILIVAPHPDDESIGCGGLIALYHEQVDVLLVTDGYNAELNNLDAAQIRQEEFKKAMECAGVHGYTMLHIPEHETQKHRDKFRKIDFSKYAHVFVPNRWELHQDHVDVYKVVKRLAGNVPKLYEYEVWTPLRRPNIIVDIASVLSKKQNMITCHASQVEELDYISLATGLSAFRGQTHGLEYAEAYYCRKELWEQRIRHLKRDFNLIK